MALGDYLRSAAGSRPLIDVPLAVLAHGVEPGVPAEFAEMAPPEVVQEYAAEPSAQPDVPAEIEPVGPELPGDVPKSATLWKEWRRWTKIVEHFALRRPSHQIKKPAYAHLYKLLLAECRSHAAQARGARRQFYLRLAEIVVPWLSPSALERTDQEILFSLLSICRQFEQELLDSTDLSADPADVGNPGDVNQIWSGWWLPIGLLVASFLIGLIWISWAR